jgi:hypothetical protein
LGEVPVTARLSIGSERLRLFFTETRIIVAHLGKRGVASPALASFFGRLGGAVEDLFKSGRESVSKRGLGRGSPEEILAADRGNFSIDYADVVRADVSLFGPLSSLDLVTKDDKLRFTTRASPAMFLELLRKALGAKVRVS